MKDLTKVFIDLSKCSEEQQKHIFSLLPEPEKPDYYEVYNNYKYLQFIPASKFGNDRWMVDKQAFGKQKLTYDEFIRLFEGSEGETPDTTAQLQADKEELLEMLEFIYGYGEKVNWEKVRPDLESLIQKHKQ